MRDPHTVAAIVGALRHVHGDDTARTMLTNGTTLAVLIDGQAQAAADLLPLFHGTAGFVERTNLKDVRIIPAFAQGRMAENEAERFSLGKQPFLLLHNEVVNVVVGLGIAAGAHPLTFAGLAGIGDLIATCASPLSRNQQLGRRLASGEKLDVILTSTRTVAEGVYTTKAALQLADYYHVEMPITKQLSLVLFEGLDPHKALPELMMRDPKSEMEGIIDD